MSCLASVVSYAESRWLASDLPIIVGIESEKFPVNNTDPIDAVASISNDNGRARISITSPLSSYAKGSYVTLEEDSATSFGYSGVYRVRNVYSSGDLTIDCPFFGNASGTIQRYYSNYNVLVRVHSGIRSGHTLAARRPIRMVGTVAVRPGSENTALCDISSFVRPDLSPIDNHYCELAFTNGWANDWNQWTQFYIEFAESYDVVSGGVLTTYTSPFTTDRDASSNINYYSVAKAANSFQYAQGKSMAEYSLNLNNFDGAGRFMTKWQRPTYFEGREWDLSIINDIKNADVTDDTYLVLQEFSRTNALIATTNYIMPLSDEGVYRWTAAAHSFNPSTKYFRLFVSYEVGGTTYINSQILTGNYENPCLNGDAIYLKWLNQLGGWDSWLFTRFVDRITDITSRGIVRRNIYANWDDSFSRGNTQDDHVSVIAFERRIVRSQYLTEDDAEQIMKWMRLSPKVQEIYRRTDTDCGNDEKRTVLPDPGTFTYLQDAERLRSAEIAFRYTDEIIMPAQ